jgi:hypothetical protein
MSVPPTCALRVRTRCKRLTVVTDGPTIDASNAVLLALVAGFVSGLFGADSIGLLLVRLGTFIRKRGR